MNVFDIKIPFANEHIGNCAGNATCCSSDICELSRLRVGAIGRHATVCVIDRIHDSSGFAVPQPLDQTETSCLDAVPKAY